MVKNPQHVAIIMDGNRRWAKAKGLPAEKGHQAGAESLERAMKEAKRQGIKFLTVYALSTENLRSRSKIEISFIFALMKKVLEEKTKIFVENEIGLKTIGDIEALPDSLQKSLAETKEKLEKFKENILIVAVNYGSREEITQAVRKLENHKEASEEDIEEKLYTASIPDPDIIIRTGGQKRLSNFLLWQASYSELFFTDTLWPDFSENEFRQVLSEFKERQRNFGK